jgi:hypothetical protein
LIPQFDGRGLLPAGVHSAVWEEVVGRFGWNERRRRLLGGLEEALKGPGGLKAAGCRRVYLNGSFVSDKQQPNDIDVCWDVAGVEPDTLDPVFFDFADGRAAQKARFGAEFFPASLPEGVTGRTFLEFFQTDRETGESKGIIELVLDG